MGSLPLCEVRLPPHHLASGPRTGGCRLRLTRSRAAPSGLRLLDRASRNRRRRRPASPLTLTITSPRREAGLLGRLARLDVHDHDALGAARQLQPLGEAGRQVTQASCPSCALPPSSVASSSLVVGEGAEGHRDALLAPPRRISSLTVVPGRLARDVAREVAVVLDRPRPSAATITSSGWTPAFSAGEPAVTSLTHGALGLLELVALREVLGHGAGSGSPASRARPSPCRAAAAGSPSRR